MHRELPSFDLVVATVGRVQELEHFLTALEFQTHQGFRLILVDQNADDRLDPVVDATGLEVLHLRSEPGLSRARNVALADVTADIVAFPDDDCAYAQGFLTHVGHMFANDPTLDGVTGRSVDRGGRSSPSWKREPAVLTDHNLWNRAISYTIFLRREVVKLVGTFDERLGLGSGEPWASGEEIDYLIRAVRSGARIRYDPSLTVRHDPSEEDTAFGTAPASDICCASITTRSPCGAECSCGRREELRLAGAQGSRTCSLPHGDAPRPTTGLPGDERREQRRVTLEPGLERELLDRPAPRPRRVSREIGEDEVDRVASASGAGGWSRSHDSACGTPTPPTSPTSSTVPPLAG